MQVKINFWHLSGIFRNLKLTNPLHTGYSLTDILTKHEEPDKMLHNVAFHQDTLLVKVKLIMDRKKKHIKIGKTDLLNFQILVYKEQSNSY